MPPETTQSDPDRVFKLALHSTRIMAWASTGFGLVVFIIDGMLNRLPQFRLMFRLISGGMWVLPGIGFIIAAIFLKRRRRWAGTLALWAAGVQLLAALVLFVMTITISPISPVPIVMTAAWAAALVQMIFHLRRATHELPQIQYDGTGFEVLAPPGRSFDQEIPSVREK